ncbi:hypothetical protein C9374_014384 [Naegleria lovaniensis]|uniref:SAM domain-containing protein n=1 Tax=Naegleria lovaniensis TaxID=51637 RepID=A0AA88H0E4_NAELO|nr:uncharacterized protein C9374_014384 [Naegleria lovaniensis]KAG2388984.1 hypothetical protein C9374_014384 [Naegleria lovaniensis]
MLSPNNTPALSTPPLLNKKPIKDWNTDDVIEFFKHHQFSEPLIECLKSHSCIGNQLIGDCVLNDLMNIGLDSNDAKKACELLQEFEKSLNTSFALDQAASCQAVDASSFNDTSFLPDDPEKFAWLQNLVVDYESYEKITSLSYTEWSHEDLALFLKANNFPLDIIYNIYNSGCDGTVELELLQDIVNSDIAKSVYHRMTQTVPSPVMSSDIELTSIKNDLIGIFGKDSKQGSRPKVDDSKLWKEEEMISKHSERIRFIKQKLTCLKLNEEELKQVSQNLVFPQRFLHKFLNPKRLPLSQQSTQPPSEPFMKVKLVIMKQSHPSIIRQIQAFPDELKNKVTKEMLQLAIMVGPWFLEWTDLSIAMVRTKPSCTPLATIELGTVQGLDNMKTAIRKVATLCTYWNASKNYNLHRYNTHSFCYCILKEMRVPFALPNHAFLSMMENNGFCELKYIWNDLSLTQQLRESNEISWDLKNELFKGNSVTFHSRELLWEFVASIQKIQPNYFNDSERKMDLQILTGFDRLFWVSESKSPMGEQLREERIRKEYHSPLLKNNQVHAKKIHRNVFNVDFRVEEFKVVDQPYETILVGDEIREYQSLKRK